MEDRRKAFREQIENLDPKGEPAKALSDGFYVATPHGTADELASQLDAYPAGMHLVIGGVGTGKTTELFEAARALREKKTHVWRIDVPASHKTTSLKRGVLLALAWMEVRNLLAVDDLPRETQAAYNDASAVAKGYWTEWYPDDDDGDMVRVDGLIQPPETDEAAEKIAPMLRTARDMRGEDIAVFFDGLDRIARSEELIRMILADMRKLKDCGIGSVTVGPPDLQLDLQRRLAEQFDHFHPHLAVDPYSENGRAFLVEVLKNRAHSNVLQEVIMPHIALASGGVVRDLLAISRNAAQAAYRDGADQIGITHVRSAIDRFGRVLMMAATPEMVKRLNGIFITLHRKRPSGQTGPYINFTATAEDFPMLTSRIIVQVAQSPNRYIIHPAILDLLRGTGDGS